jgi:hypothetical protein
MRGTTLEDLYAGVSTHDYDFVSLDLTKSRLAAAVSSWVRELVYLRGATGTDPVWVVIADRATVTSTNYEMRWLLHPSAEPTVSGHSGSGGLSRGATGSDGKTYYTGATLANWVQNSTLNGATYNTQGWWTPVLPAARTINKIWGANTGTGLTWQPSTPPRGDTSHIAASGASTDSHEAEDAYGYQGDIRLVPTGPEYDAWVGPGRLESRPTTAALSNTFLNAIEVAGTSDSQTATSSSTTATMAGVFFHGAIYRGAVLGVAGNGLTTGSFITPTAGLAWRIAVCSLAPSTSKTFDPGANVNIEGQGAGNVYTTTTSAAGCVYLNMDVTGSASDAAHTTTF